MIIDCHGHCTTAPAALEQWRKRQIDALANPAAGPRASDLEISDDELRESVENAQIRIQRERGAEVTIFSPRASFMAHHIGNADTSAAWASICNELIHRVCTLFPRNFIGACMLPQSPGIRPETCVPGLVRCIEQYGFVACNLNPDPSGGHWKEPPLTDRWWYPLCEKLVELDVPVMVHVSTSCNASFHTTGAHCLNADTTAFMQFVASDLFKDFPTLKFIIPHGGGAAPYHWGRFRGLAQDMNKPLLKNYLLGNVYFDTCVYHQPGIDLLLRVIPVDNILFASEMVGAVRGIDPETGRYYDDTRRYVEGAPGLIDAQRGKIFEATPAAYLAGSTRRWSKAHERIRCRRHPCREDRKRAGRKLGRLGVATVHEALGRSGLLRPYMRPAYAGAGMCGTALMVLVHPGDVIVGGDDGVVVVPRARAEMIAQAAEQREAKEAGVRKRLAAGEPGLDMYSMREALARAGLRYVDGSKR